MSNQKYKIRASRETIICVDIEPSELREIADRLDRGSSYDQVIYLRGAFGKAGDSVEIRFIRARGIKDGK